MQAGSGSWRVTEMLIDSGLSQTAAEEATQPISSLLDSIFDRTWSLADERTLTGTTRNVRQTIKQSVQGVTCHKVAWVSLQKTMNPRRPNWLTDSEFSELKDEYAERMLGLLENKLRTPLCRVLYSPDLTSCTQKQADELDNFWAELSDHLPERIKKCVEQQVDASCSYGNTENLTDLIRYALFRAIINFLTMRYLNRTEESQILLPLLQLLDQGVVPIGIANPLQPKSSTWLVIIS